MNSDRLISKMQAAMLASAEEQNSRKSAGAIRAVVTSVSSDGTKVGIRRLHNVAPDGITYPVIAGAYPVSVGDRVWCRRMNGGIVVEGRTKRTGDRNVPDLAQNKLERNGSQDFTPASGAMLRVNKGTSTDRVVAELYKDFGSGIQSTALRFHQSGRYWQRIEADHNGISFFTGDPSSLARVPVFVADAQADNGASIKDNRTRADAGRAVADDAWNRANAARGVADDAWNRANRAQSTADSKVGQHHHIYTRTNWTNFLASDGRTYMISGFWEDRPTSGIVL